MSSCRPCGFRPLFIPFFFLSLALHSLGCGPIPEESTIRLEPGAADEDAPEEFTETESGVRYRILRKGDGRQPGPKDGVRVYYRGWLDGGRVFDSCYGKREAFFTVDGVVPGFSEGLQLVSIGGMIELEIPAEKGYGELGNPPGVPPNATLHFLVELEDIAPAIPD